MNFVRLTHAYIKHFCNIIHTVINFFVHIVTFVSYHYLFALFFSEMCYPIYDIEIHIFRARGTLSLMQSQLDRYEEYVEEVKKCNEIKDVRKHGEALLKAEDKFNLWMNVYPESESWKARLNLTKTPDEFMDRIKSPKIIIGGILWIQYIQAN
jgi:hypothetical protein